MAESCGDHALGQTFARLRTNVTADESNVSPPLLRNFPECSQDAGDATPHNQDAGQVVCGGQQFLDHPIRLVRLLMSGAAVLDQQLGSVFTHIGTEACVSDILALIAVIAYEHRNPSGTVGHLRDQPRRGAPQLPVVRADIGGALRGRLVGDIGHDRRALFSQFPNGLADQRMIGGDNGNRIAFLSERHEPSRYVVGRQVIDEIDDRIDDLIAAGATGGNDVTAEQLIEFARGLLEEEAHPIVWGRPSNPVFDGADAIESDAFGGALNALHRLPPDRSGSAENPVHGRNGHSCRFCEIGDRWAIHAFSDVGACAIMNDMF